MANSEYEDMDILETNDNMLLDTWIVIRIHVCDFTKFYKIHLFEKPNDMKALMMMNNSAMDVMKDLTNITFAYGFNNEYSFALNKSSMLYQ